MAELDCEILTPDGRVFEGRAEMVVVPGAEGELGVLPRHAPIIARLKVGEVRVKFAGNEWRSWAINEGYFKMQYDRAHGAGRGRRRRDRDRRREGPRRCRGCASAGSPKRRAATVELDRYRAERDLLYAENRISIAGR